MSEPTPEQDVPLVEPLSERAAGSRTLSRAAVGG